MATDRTTKKTTKKAAKKTAKKTAKKAAKKTTKKATKTAKPGKKAEELTRDMRETLLLQLERCVYDIQKWRIGAGQRAGNVEALLTDADKAFFSRVEDDMKSIEDAGTRRLLATLKGIPIWEKFLLHVKGVGPKMGALLVAETHIENCSTPSKLWAWWGLHVVDGRAASRKAGEKASYSPFRKAKMVKVLAESLIKQKSPGYYDAYNDYKHRKETQVVQECMACKGTGQANRKNEETGKTEKVECWNCGGTGGPAPWGVTPEHRHRAALRYMVKRLLLDMWKCWRELEGLEVVPSYAEAYQSETHPAR